MNISKLTAVALSGLFAISVSAAEETETIEIPKKIQKKILAAAPEVDTNEDGKISAEELKAGIDKLPKKQQKKLAKYLPEEEAAN